MEQQTNEKESYKLDLRGDFYRSFLKPREGERNTAFLLMAMARKKYHSSMAINGGAKCLGRRVLRAERLSERSFLQALSILEFEASLSVDKEGKPIPREACVFYVSANRLDEKRAYYQHFESMFDHTKKVGLMAPTSGAVGFDGILQSPPLPNVLNDWMSCLSKSAVRDVMKLDVDTKEKDKLDILREVLSEHNLVVNYSVETRGGYHVLLQVGQNMESLYRLAKEVTSEMGGPQHSWLTVESPNKSPLLAIPGTTQCEFLVRPADVGW